MKYTLDAKGRSIGRVASEAAAALLGKQSPAVKKNVVADISVTIENASQARISAKKRSAKTYTRYTGYPGGLRTESPDEVISKKGYAEVFRRAVYGMLPGNRLRAQRMKKLIVNE